MKGTVLRPEYLEEGRVEKKWLTLWQEDTDKAFDNIGYPGFSYGGMGAEYWTPISHFLGGDIIPLAEYEEVAIRFMERTPLTSDSYHIYDDIMWQGAQTRLVCQWFVDNFATVESQIEALRKTENGRRTNALLAKGLHQRFVMCLTFAPNNSTLRDFFKKQWYEEPSGYEKDFASAFKVDGVYGKEADEAMYLFIKICRIRLKNLHREWKEYFIPDDEYRRQEAERITNGVKYLLHERYGWNEVVKPLWNKDKNPLIPEREVELRTKLAFIDAKIERVMRAQNAYCPPK